MFNSVKVWDFSHIDIYFPIIKTSIFKPAIRIDTTKVNANSNIVESMSSKIDYSSLI